MHVPVDRFQVHDRKGQSSATGGSSPLKTNTEAEVMVTEQVCRTRIHVRHLFIIVSTITVPMSAGSESVLDCTIVCDQDGAVEGVKE